MNKTDKKIKKIVEDYYKSNFGEITTDIVRDKKALSSLLALIFSPIITVIVFFIIIFSSIIGILIYPLSLYIKYKEKIERKNIAKTITKDLNDFAEKLHKDDPYYTLGDNFSFPFGSSLTNFIYLFIINYNYRFSTYDQKGKPICAPGKRRSLGDIYLICKCYYPECTIHDVLKSLIFHLKMNPDIIKGSYCTDICKYVFTSSKTSSFIALDRETEYSDLKFIDFYNHFK